MVNDKAKLKRGYTHFTTFDSWVKLDWIFCAKKSIVDHGFKN